MVCRYKIAFILLAILLSFCMLVMPACNCKQESSTTAVAPASEPAITPATTELEKTKSFIWKITSESTFVYLLGSLHYGMPSLYPLESAIDEAFELADKLAVEVDVTAEGSEAAALQLILKYGTYPPGENLKKNIPDDLYTKLNEQFNQFGINMLVLDTYRPWVISLLLSQLIWEEMGYDAKLGIDFYFLEIAKKKKKDIIELETPEYQIQVLSSIPDEVMILSLEEDVGNMPTPEEIEALFTAWADGDAAGLETIVFEALERNPSLAPLYEKTYDERNLNLAEKIEEFLAGSEVYFVVVGAGHLVGKNGMINMMLEKEYKVEQLGDKD